MRWIHANCASHELSPITRIKPWGRMLKRAQKYEIFLWYLLNGFQHYLSVGHSVLSDSLRPHGGSLPGSSVHGILQARILEWDAMPSSKGSFWPRDWTQVSRIEGRYFSISATGEAPILTQGLINKCSWKPRAEAVCHASDSIFTGKLKWWERWDGEGCGRGVQDGKHMYSHGWFMLMYGKNHYNIVK